MNERQMFFVPRCLSTTSWPLTAVAATVAVVVAVHLFRTWTVAVVVVVAAAGGGGAVGVVVTSRTKRTSEQFNAIQCNAILPIQYGKVFAMLSRNRTPTPRDALIVESRQMANDEWRMALLCWFWSYCTVRMMHSYMDTLHAKGAHTVRCSHSV